MCIRDSDNIDMISVVVLVENGGGGGSVASPIAKEIFKKYNNKINYDQIRAIADSESLKLRFSDTKTFKSFESHQSSKLMYSDEYQKKPFFCLQARFHAFEKLIMYLIVQLIFDLVKDSSNSKASFIIFSLSSFLSILEGNFGGVACKYRYWPVQPHLKVSAPSIAQPAGIMRAKSDGTGQQAFFLVYRRYLV